jgi:uncharacterized tellurite resistance protein B-like protein
MTARHEIFASLVNLAAADHKFTDEEVEYLAARAGHWGISSVQFDEAISRIATGLVRIELPNSAAERRHLLEEMIRLMAADGELAPVEKRLCAMASAKMGFSTAEFIAIVDGLLHPGADSDA